MFENQFKPAGPSRAYTATAAGVRVPLGEIARRPVGDFDAADLDIYVRGLASDVFVAVGDADITSSGSDGLVISPRAAATISIRGATHAFLRAPGGDTEVILTRGQGNLARVPASPQPATLLASASFTRPNDTVAYASGDLVANSTVAGSVVPAAVSAVRVPGGSGQLWRCRLRKSTGGLTNASFRAHLFSGAAAPAVVNGDNGVFMPGSSADYCGAFDITMDRAFNDGAVGIGVPLLGPAMVFRCAPALQTLWVLVEARAAYGGAGTANEAFTVTLEGMAD